MTRNDQDRYFTTDSVFNSGTRGDDGSRSGGQYDQVWNTRLRRIGRRRPDLHREADHELQIHPAGWRTGSIDEIGLSIGATEGGVLVWSVISAQQGVPAGALAGKYTGLSANASVGVGLGENVLIGGNNSSFMLQPTSYEGQVGLNVAAGVTTVTLTWAQ